jgi:hypothetical protein
MYSVKTVLAWTLALLSVVAIGVGIEAALARPTGTVTGVFEAIGGPARVAALGPIPLEGSVYLTAVTPTCSAPTDPHCQTVATVSSDADGRFSITAPAGSYFLVGSSRMMGDGRLVTDGNSYVRLTAGTTVHADVRASMM